MKGHPDKAKQRRSRTRTPNKLHPRKRQQTYIALDEDIREWLKDAAYAESASLSQVIRKILKKAFDAAKE